MQSFRALAIAAVASAIKLEDQEQSLSGAMLAEAEVLDGPYKRWSATEKLSPVYTEEQRALDAGELVSDSSEIEVEQE
jgi:hypothetical protein